MSLCLSDKQINLFILVERQKDKERAHVVTLTGKIPQRPITDSRGQEERVAGAEIRNQPRSPRHTAEIPLSHHSYLPGSALEPMAGGTKAKYVGYR